MIVRWISILLILISQSSQAKRFIVHYKERVSTPKQGLNPLSIESRVIVEGRSKEEIKRVLADKELIDVEEDIILKPTLEPGETGAGDTFYREQWHYYEEGGIELPSAWDITTGEEDIVVAVVDTGITEHPDLKNKILSGADLISEYSMSGDGDGRDNDPRDEGDYIGPGDPCFQGFEQSSSWHGTHVAGTVAAESDNGLGVTGVSWGAKVLPVRVLGKCGGYLSDIADGIRWAAGGSVSGVAANKNPADIINLSLGGVGACGRTIQGAIDFAISKGAVVVVAAGNDAQNLDFTSYVPANCRQVVTVGASNRNSFRSSYSNYGLQIDIMAPGGDYSGSIMSTSNAGRTAPSRASYKGMSGTSMAAPHVAGVVALIKSVAPDLFPAQIRSILKESAKFINCDQRGGCGAGILDSFTALQIARTTVPDGSFQGTEPINSAPDSPAQERLVASDESGGGMCGSVAFVDGGSPPKGGLGAFVFSLILGLGVSSLTGRLKWC